MSDIMAHALHMSRYMHYLEEAMGSIGSHINCEIELGRTCTQDVTPAFGSCQAGELMIEGKDCQSDCKIL